MISADGRIGFGCDSPASGDGNVVKLEIDKLPPVTGSTGTIGVELEPRSIGGAAAPEAGCLSVSPKDAQSAASLC